MVRKWTDLWSRGVAVLRKGNCTQKRWAWGNITAERLHKCGTFAVFDAVRVDTPSSNTRSRGTRSLPRGTRLHVIHSTLVLLIVIVRWKISSPAVRNDKNVRKPSDALEKKKKRKTQTRLSPDDDLDYAKKKNGNSAVRVQYYTVYTIKYAHVCTKYACTRVYGGKRLQQPASFCARAIFEHFIFFFSPFDFNLFHIILMIPRCQPKRFCACFFFFFILSLCDDYACPCPRSPSPKTGLPFRSPLLPRPRVSSSSLHRHNGTM